MKNLCAKLFKLLRTRNQAIQGCQKVSKIILVPVDIPETACGAVKWRIVPHKSKTYCTAPQTALFEIFASFNLFANAEMLINKNILLYSFSGISSYNISVYRLVELLCNK